MSAPAIDLYQILHVTPDSTREEIELLYRKLVDETTLDQLQQTLNVVYKILSDPLTRKRYDDFRLRTPNLSIREDPEIIYDPRLDASLDWRLLSDFNQAFDGRRSSAEQELFQAMRDSRSNPYSQFVAQPKQERYHECIVPMTPSQLLITYEMKQTIFHLNTLISYLDPTQNDAPIIPSNLSYGGASLETQFGLGSVFIDRYGETDEQLQQMMNFQTADLPDLIQPLSDLIGAKSQELSRLEQTLYGRLQMAKLDSNKTLLYQRQIEYDESVSRQKPVIPEHVRVELSLLLDDLDNFQGASYLVEDLYSVLKNYELEHILYILDQRRLNQMYTPESCYRSWSEPTKRVYDVNKAKTSKPPIIALEDIPALKTPSMSGLIELVLLNSPSPTSVSAPTSVPAPISLSVPTPISVPVLDLSPTSPPVSDPVLVSALDANPMDTLTSTSDAPSDLPAKTGWFSRWF